MLMLPANTLSLALYFPLESIASVREELSHKSLAGCAAKRRAARTVTDRSQHLSSDTKLQ
jgi:hypothetical protein